MAKQTINVGTSNNDGTGDKLRAAFTKANANFDELYGLTSTVSSAAITMTAAVRNYSFTGSTARTWALPALGSGFVGTIKNRSAAYLTIVSAAGGADIYTISPVASFQVGPGEAVRLRDDGTYYVVE